MSIKHNLEQWISQLDYDDTCDISDRQVSELIRGYSALEDKCAALTAEKEKFAVECAATKIAIAYMKSGRQDFTLNTPATDAFLAEVRAQGVEMFMESDECSQEAYGLALRFAAQLRQDANTAELVAAGIITKVGE